MFYLMKSKYAIFSDIKVTRIERSAFILDTRYSYYGLSFMGISFYDFESQLHLKKEHRTQMNLKVIKIYYNLK